MQEIKKSTLIENIPIDCFSPQNVKIDLAEIPLKQSSNSSELFKFAQQEIEQEINTPQNQSNQLSRPRISYQEKNKKILNQKNSERSLMKKVRPNKFFSKFLFKQSIIQKFIENLKKNSYILPKILTEVQQNYFEENYIKIKNQTKLQKPDSNSKKIINPLGNFIIIWNTFRAFQVLFLMWWFPFKTAFKPILEQQFEQAQQFFYYSFILDIIIKLNCGFLEDGEIIYNRKLRFNQYLSKELLFDIIYLLTQIFLIENILNDIFIFTEIFTLIQFFLNYNKLKAKFIKLEEVLITNSNYLEISRLLQLILLVIFFGHLMACIWYYIGDKSLQIYDTSWILSLNNQEIIGYYLCSFYWATTTMVTVGYGDVTPQNDYERLCAIILMIFSSGIFAFVISSIGSIFTSLDLEKQQYKRSLLLINQYMQQNEVDSQLQSRVRNCLKMQQKITNIIKNEQIDQMLEKLPINLQDDIQKNIQQKLISQIQFYKDNFSHSILPTISKSLQLQYFSPSETIFIQDIIDDCSLFTVWKGEVQIIDKISGKIFATLTKGQSFGELEFFNNQCRQFTAISKDISQILRMPRDKFLQIISISSNDFQKFHLLKYQQIFDNKNSIVKCYCCNQEHNLLSCKSARYFPNIFKMINQTKINYFQERYTYKRNDIKSTFLKQKSNNSQIQIPLPSVNQFKSSTHLIITETTKNEKSNFQFRKSLNGQTKLTLQPRINQINSLDEQNSSNNLASPESLIVASSLGVFNQNSKLIQDIKYTKNNQLKSQDKISSVIFDQLDHLNTETQTFFQIDIDKIRSYSIYNTQNNIEQILSQLYGSKKSKKTMIIENLQLQSKPLLKLNLIVEN